MDWKFRCSSLSWASPQQRLRAYGDPMRLSRWQKSVVQSAARLPCWTFHRSGSTKYGAQAQLKHSIVFSLDGSRRQAEYA